MSQLADKFYSIIGFVQIICGMAEEGKDVKAITAASRSINDNLGELTGILVK